MKSAIFGMMLISSLSVADVVVTPNQVRASSVNATIVATVNEVPFLKEATLVNPSLVFDQDVGYGTSVPALNNEDTNDALCTYFGYGAVIRTETAILKGGAFAFDFDASAGHYDVQSFYSDYLFNTKIVCTMK